MQHAAQRVDFVEALRLADDCALYLELTGAGAEVNRPDLEQVPVLAGHEEPPAVEGRAGDPGRRNGVAQSHGGLEQRASRRRVRGLDGPRPVPEQVIAA